jgi:hypothetical protein
MRIFHSPWSTRSRSTLDRHSCKHELGENEGGLDDVQEQRGRVERSSELGRHSDDRHHEGRLDRNLEKDPEDDRPAGVGLDFLLEPFEVLPIIENAGDQDPDHEKEDPAGPTPEQASFESIGRQPDRNQGLPR